MKKASLSILAILFVFTIALSCASCSTASPEQKLEQYIAANQKQFDKTVAAYNSIMRSELTSEGTTLIYNYTYMTLLSKDNAAKLKQSLDEKSAGSSATYEAVAKEMEGLGIKPAKVEVRYNNADGTNIVTYEYTAK